MSAKLIRSNVRVEIRADAGMYVTFAKTDAEIFTRDHNLAAGILESIRRHVDGIDSATVCWDAFLACEFCKEPWETSLITVATEDEPLGLPLCCQKAQDEFWAAA